MYHRIAWLVVALNLFGLSSTAPAEPPKDKTWELAFEDDFSGTTADLSARWAFQNGPSGHILCSRWRENAVVDNGVLRLLNKKETRAGQDWTSASIWTKQEFKYGYFECRYKYGSTTGLNNSFWLMTSGKERPEVPVRFEIDINEGHFPNQINTNIHKWSPPHTANHRAFALGVNPRYYFTFEKPVETDKLRLLVRDSGRARVTELRVYPFDKQGYPTAAPDGSLPANAALNLASKAQATASSAMPQYPAAKAIDGGLDVASRWVSADGAHSPHTLTLEFDRKHPIGCIDLLTGTRNKKNGWDDPLADFVLQSWDGHQWTDIPGTDSRTERVDLSRDFHVYGLEWNERELVFYFDGRALRREPNVFCHGPAPVLLSSAIIRWAGQVSDRIDGTSMDVDYVRIYRAK